MIADLNQIKYNKSISNAGYIISRAGQNIASAGFESKLIGKDEKIFLWIPGATDYTMCYDKAVAKSNPIFFKVSEIREKPYFITDESGSRIGTIWKRNTGFCGRQYYEINFKDRCFKAFEIGLGKGGHFFDVFEGGKQVCCIQKDNIVYNNFDTYKLYIPDEEYFHMACLFTMYYQYHHKRKEYAKEARVDKVTNYVNTNDKELLALHNPQFIESCEA